MTKNTELINDHLRQAIKIAIEQLKNADNVFEAAHNAHRIASALYEPLHIRREAHQRISRAAVKASPTEFVWGLHDHEKYPDHDGTKFNPKWPSVFVEDTYFDGPGFKIGLGHPSNYMSWGEMPANFRHYRDGFGRSVQVLIRHDDVYYVYRQSASGLHDFYARIHGLLDGKLAVTPILPEDELGLPEGWLDTAPVIELMSDNNHTERAAFYDADSGAWWHVVHEQYSAVRGEWHVSRFEKDNVGVFKVRPSEVLPSAEDLPEQYPYVYGPEQKEVLGAHALQIVAAIERRKKDK